MSRDRKSFVKIRQELADDVENLRYSYVWPKMWGTSYSYSYAICISTSGLAIIMCILFRQYLKGLNRELDKKEKLGQMAGQKMKSFRYIT
jgi:hypothetical protein